MEAIAEAITQNPQTALTLVAVLCALGFAWLLFSSFKARVDKFETAVDEAGSRINFAQNAFDLKFNELKSGLFTHSSDMGKATKAIQGDFLKMKEQLLNLKQELISEVEKVKALSLETTSSLKLANEITKLSIEGMNEKLGKIIVIEKEIDILKRQLPIVQEGIGQTRTEVIKYTSQIGSLAKHLQDTRTKLNSLELEIKKRT